MHWKKIMFITLALLLALSSTSFASDVPKLHMYYVEDGQRLKLFVKATDVESLYAFELKISYDSETWKLIHHQSEMSGFHVEPLIKTNQIRFGHTQFGTLDGIDGTQTLASFLFERIGDGEAEFSVYEGRLVNTDLQATVLKPEFIQSVVPKVKLTTELQDITGHWAESSIVAGSSLGVVSGYPDGTFRPDQLITRAELVTMLLRTFNIKGMDVSVEQFPFQDYEQIPGWARGHAAAGKYIDIVRGYEDQTFRALKSISRLEIAQLVVTALNQTTTSTVAQKFDDYNSIPRWGQAAANIAVEQGIIHGKQNNKFDPNSPATRAEAITIIFRMYQNQLWNVENNKFK